MNVLLTCAGRRNYLVNFFREALEGRGRVLAVDAAAEATALQEADAAFLAPPVTDPDYPDFLLDLCRSEKVRLLVPLNDLELPVLARRREEFLAAGTIPVVSRADVVDLCFDKWAAHLFLENIGLQPPRTFLCPDEARQALERGEISFPLVVKPRWGTASIGLEFPADAEELDLALRLGRMRLQRTSLGAVSSADPERSLIIQERLDGEEYGLDVVNDLTGRHVTTFVRHKLAMRAGETDRAVTVAHRGLEEVGRRLGEALGHIGNLDCDVFVCGERLRVLELNPRFGGGYPFSHGAGADLPATLLAWAAGKLPDPRWLALRPQVMAGKCDRILRLYPDVVRQSAEEGASNLEALAPAGMP